MEAVIRARLGANAFTMDLAYEADDDLLSLTHTGPKPLTFGFGRNDSGQITTLSASDGTFLSRPSATQAVAYVPNRLNQYASVGGTAQSWDANGNLTGDGVWVFEYDEENRLRSAVGGGTSAAYEYDPLGRRRAKTVNGSLTRFVSDNAEEIEERTAAQAVLRRYIYGSGIDERIALIEVATPSLCPGTGGRCFYLTNWQGSTTTLVNANGSLNATYHYGPYGEQVGWSPGDSGAGNPFRYTGRRLDPETGLYYYRARFYSPALGRFLQTDPIGVRDDSNLYGYTGNDSVNKLDPDGLAAQACALNPSVCARLLVTAFRVIAAAGATIAATPVVVELADAIGEAVTSSSESGNESGPPDSGGEASDRTPSGGGNKNNRPDQTEPLKSGSSEARPKGTPHEFLESPSNKGGGRKFSDPRNPHDNVRDMPGNPNSPNEAQRNPYVKQMRDGKAIDKHGNPVDPNSPDAHIPRDDFSYHPKK